jgi:hypothetical protein
MAEWARIGGGLSVSFSEFVIIDLAVCEFKEDSALPMAGHETSVYCSSHHFCGRHNLYVLKIEPSV